MVTNCEVYSRNKPLLVSRDNHSAGVNCTSATLAGLINCGPTTAPTNNPAKGDQGAPASSLNCDPLTIKANSSFLEMSNDVEGMRWSLCAVLVRLLNIESAK